MVAGRAARDGLSSLFYIKYPCHAEEVTGFE